jgi:hypothetical protein
VILEGLAERYSLHIKTEIPEAFFRLYLGDRFQLHRQQVDAGCVQKDFIDIEVDECFRRLAAFQAAKPEWLEAEKRWLAEAQIQLVLSDCSSLPLQAARALGLPSIVIKTSLSLMLSPENTPRPHCNCCRNATPTALRCPTAGKSDSLPKRASTAALPWRTIGPKR